MAKLEYFVVAESVIVDSATNKTSIINVLEDLPVPTVPSVVAMEFAAVSLWRAEAGDNDRDWQVMLRIWLPDGAHHEFPTNFRFVSPARRHRIIQRIGGIPVPAYGDLKFELLLNGEHAAWHVVTVLSLLDATVGYQPPAAH